MACRIAPLKLSIRVIWDLRERSLALRTTSCNNASICSSVGSHSGFNKSTRGMLSFLSLILIFHVLLILEKANHRACGRYLTNSVSKLLRISASPSQLPVIISRARFPSKRELGWEAQRYASSLFLGKMIRSALCMASRWPIR